MVNQKYKGKYRRVSLAVFIGVFITWTKTIHQVEDQTYKLHLIELKLPILSLGV